MKKFPKYHFKKRIPELLNLEGEYNSLAPFKISCRHKDILNAGNTRHFTSCYRTHGLYEEAPFQICTQEDLAILGQKDMSGQYLWRAFIKYIRLYKEIIVYKIYGNPPADVYQIIELELKYRLGDRFRVRFTPYDCSTINDLPF